MLLSMFLFYSTSVSPNQVKIFNELSKIFKMQPNELSLTARITFYLMMALQPTDYVVSPFVNLSLPDGKKGHPYMADIFLEQKIDDVSINEVSIDQVSIDEVSIDEASPSTDVASPSIDEATWIMTPDSKVKAIVEVKKSVNDDILLVEPKVVIETALYVRYVMNLYGEEALTAMITDGTTWHCIKFSSSNETHLKVRKYLTFHAKEQQLAGILPTVLKLMI